MTSTPEEVAALYDDLTAGSITDDQLDDLRAELRAAQQYGLIAEQCAERRGRLLTERTAQRNSARRWAVALEQDATLVPGLHAALDQVRALHTPMERGGLTICGLCSGWSGSRCTGAITPWPCTTVRALNAPSGPAMGPHGAPQGSGGPEVATTPERPSSGRTDARGDTTED